MNWQVKVAIGLVAVAVVGWFDTRFAKSLLLLFSLSSWPISSTRSSIGWREGAWGEFGVHFSSSRSFLPGWC